MQRETGFYKVKIKLMPEVSTYEVAEYLSLENNWYRCGISETFKDDDFVEIENTKIL